MRQSRYRLTAFGQLLFVYQKDERPEASTLLVSDGAFWRAVARMWRSPRGQGWRSGRGCCGRSRLMCGNLPSSGADTTPPGSVAARGPGSLQEGEARRSRRTSTLGKTVSGGSGTGPVVRSGVATRRASVPERAARARRAVVLKSTETQGVFTAARARRRSPRARKVGGKRRTGRLTAGARVARWVGIRRTRTHRGTRVSGGASVGERHPKGRDSLRRLGRLQAKERGANGNARFWIKPAWKRPVHGNADSLAAA